MGASRWKLHERAVALALGGERQPNTGSTGADVLAGPFPLWGQDPQGPPPVAPEGPGPGQGERREIALSPWWRWSMRPAGG